MMENMVTLWNCCSSQAITEKNPKLGNAVEKALKKWKNELYFYQFLRLTAISGGYL